MKKKSKFNQEQEKIIIEFYTLCGSSIREIIQRCNFEISRGSIYKILRDNNVPLIRKTGVKHDLIGKKFGYLIVAKMAQTKKSGNLNEWRAICDCDNCGKSNVDVHPQALLRNQTTSCGCRRDQYKKITGKNSKQYKGYEELNGKYWGVIRKRAERRGYELNIDIKFAWDLYIKQNRKCALSGLPIKFAISNRKSPETTASLDRIDSLKKYTEDNVQWVHKDVNIMKNVYDQKYFIGLCELISKNCC